MAKKKIVERLLNEYRLTIRNEDDFEERGVYIVTLVKVISIFLIQIIVLSLITFFVGRYITTEYYTSGYKTKQLEQENLTIELLQKTNSLETSVNRKQEFIESFKHYLDGNDSNIPEVKVPDYNVPPVQQNTSLNEPVKERASNKTLTDVYFLTPIEGYSVSREFDVSGNHFGVDIVAKEGEPILSIADGTVIFSSWTDETGYVVGIQHEGSITSLYKHNSIVLKNIGEIVKAGDVVAIIGNSGKFTSGPHLHFEMWHNGEAINPEHYISFEK